MSAIRSLSKVKRTYLGSRGIDANDPKLSFSVDKVVDALGVAHRSAPGPSRTSAICVLVPSEWAKMSIGTAYAATNTNGKGSDLLEVHQ